MQVNNRELYLSVFMSIEDMSTDQIDKLVKEHAIIRESRGVSQIDIGKLLRTSSPNVCQIERGKTYSTVRLTKYIMAVKHLTEDK